MSEEKKQSPEIIQKGLLGESQTIQALSTPTPRPSAQPAPGNQEASAKK